MSGRTKVIVISGPTGSGKSEVAVKVAKSLSGEIVCTDSVQIFRHFDIGTGKPSKELRSQVPHHLVDCIEPDKHFTLWDFKKMARKTISEIVSRGNVPILAGGTGLYIKATLENLDGGVSAEPQLRKSLMESIKSEGTQALYEWLIRIDPSASARIHPNDTHRIIRGIENSLLQADSPAASLPPASVYDPSYFILSGPRKDVYKRIDSRVARMFGGGWIKEADSILQKGYNADCKPFQSVGYKQIMQYLKEAVPIETLIEDVKMQTRRYAKRQITWLNSVKEAIIINSVSPDVDYDELADFIENCFKQKV